MNRFQLLRELRRHIRLSEKRSMAYNQNKTAKVIMYILGGFSVVYLIFLAVLFALIANETSTYTPYELLYGLLPFFSAVDFGFRFMAQQTPSQLVKPYILLPIPKHACIETFIFSSMITPNNLLWLAIFLPYSIMTILFSEGLLAMLGFLLGWIVLIIINSQWYMMVRTLINDHFWWWILPAAVYALLLAPWYLKDFDFMMNLYGSLGEGLTFWHILAWLGVIALLVAFFFANRSMQFAHVYKELANVEQTKLHNVSQFKYLDRFGEVGEYVKLEIKSIMRNKNMRKGFISSVIIVTIFSLLLSFTDIYDDNFNSNFLAFYNFGIFGLMGLSKVMSAEGNYIDGLMVHKENIISLLKAKYFFYVAMLLLPLLLMIPTVVQGKCSVLMLLSIFVFTAGIEYFLILQCAVYNKQTIPLNSKFIAKGSVETNYWQLVISMAVLFIPVILIIIMLSILSRNTAYLVLMGIGLLFILTNSLWIRNIYNRLMRRRYENMESFRATR
ncbi:MAG: hypothetical protein J5506_03475 [Prevotella sp.]|nr:hypothetical protein [Prevotella sp.]